MLSKIRRINLVLAVVALFQIALLLGSSPVKAQTAAFLKRPYYGPYVAWTSVFDHHCPDYNIASDCNNSNYYYTYLNPAQNGPGYGRILNYKGGNAASVLGDRNPPILSYSGHSGYDFALAYKPVVASAPGQITASQWWDTNHEIGYGLYVLVQHTPNYSLHRTLYGHLSMVRYAQGQQVGYWQIGTSGNTGRSTAAHLHFELQRWSGIWKPKDMYGWDGAGADPWPTYGGGPVSEWLWLDDREQTPPTYSGDYLLDNDDLSWPTHFVLGCNAGTGVGNCPYWWFIYAGYNSNLRYTLPSGTTPDYWAKWIAPNLPSTGQYEVEVYIPNWDTDFRSHAVRYEIVHQNGTQVVVVDQHDVNYGTWISLGRYNFNAGSTHYVRVTDAAYVGDYVDPTWSLSKKILVDAIRWRKTH